MNTFKNPISNVSDNYTALQNELQAHIDTNRLVAKPANRDGSRTYNTKIGHNEVTKTSVGAFMSLKFDIAKELNEVRNELSDEIEIDLPLSKLSTSEIDRVYTALMNKLPANHLAGRLYRAFESLKSSGTFIKIVLTNSIGNTLEQIVPSMSLSKFGETLQVYICNETVASNDDYFAVATSQRQVVKRPATPIANPELNNLLKILNTLASLTNQGQPMPTVATKVTDDSVVY